MQRSMSACRSKPPALVAGNARLTGGCCVTLRTCSKILSQHLLSGDRLPPARQTPAPKRSAEPAQALQGFVMPWRTRKKPRRSQMRQFESPCCATVGSLTTNSAQIKPSITRSKTAPQCLQKVVMLSWPESARLPRATVAPILAPAEKERSLGLRSSLRSLRRCRSDRSLAHLPGTQSLPACWHVQRHVQTFLHRQLLQQDCVLTR